MLVNPTKLFSKGSLPMDRTTINHIYDLEAKLTGVEMVITGAVVSDSGTYECKATNTQGTVTKRIYVQVDAVEGSSRRYF